MALKKSINFFLKYRLIFKSLVNWLFFVCFINIWQSVGSSHPHWLQVFESGDRDTGNQACLVNLHPHFVFWTPPTGTVGTFLVPLAWLSAQSWSARLLHGKLLDLLECTRSTLFEACSMGVLVNVNGIFSAHRLVAGRMVLFTILLCGSHSAGPGWKEKTAMDYWLIGF